MAEARPDLGMTKEIEIFQKGVKQVEGVDDVSYFTTTNENRKRVVAGFGRLSDLRPKLAGWLAFDTIVSVTSVALEKYSVFSTPLVNDDVFVQRTLARLSTRVAGVPEVGTPALNPQKAASTKALASTRRSFQHLRAARVARSSSGGSIRSTSASAMPTDGNSSFHSMYEAEDVTADVEGTLRLDSSTTRSKVMDDAPVALMASAVDSTGGNTSIRRVASSSTKELVLMTDPAWRVASAVRVDDRFGGFVSLKTSYQSVVGGKSRKKNGMVDRVGEFLATPENPDDGVASAAERMQVLAIKQRQRELPSGKTEFGDVCRSFASVLDRKKLRALAGNLGSEWFEQNLAPLVTVPIFPSPPQPTLPSPATPTQTPTQTQTQTPTQTQTQPILSMPHLCPDQPTPPCSVQLSEKVRLRAGEAAWKNSKPLISTEPKMAAAIDGIERPREMDTASDEEKEFVSCFPSVRDGDDSSVGHHLDRLSEMKGDGDVMDFEKFLNEFNLVTAQAGVAHLQRFLELRRRCAEFAG